MRRHVELPSTDNVAAGSTMIQSMPVGGATYDRIALALTNISNAQITNIRVKINGREIWFFDSGTTLQLINDYYGRPSNAGYLDFYFNRPEMVNLLQERLTGIGTVDVQTFTVEADIDGAVLNPAVEGLATLSDPRKLGLITKVKRYPASYAVSGQVENKDIVLGPRIMAAHFIKADVNRVEIEQGSRVVFERDKADLEVDQEGYGRVPQTASMTSVDFMLEGDHAQAMVTSENRNGVDRTIGTRFLTTLGTSGAVPTYVEYLDAFTGL